MAIRTPQEGRKVEPQTVLGPVTVEWNPREVFDNHGLPLEFKRGASVYRPDEAPGHLYWIREGEVSLVRHTPDGREFTLDIHRSGTAFGEQELLLDMPRHSHALCRADTRVLAMPRPAVWALRRDSADFAWWLNHILAVRQSRLQSRLETLLFKSATGKVAQMLVDLARDYGRLTEDGTLIDYPITHQEIGSMIGTTRETVSYAFMDFRQRGLIATRQRRTIVRDLDGLGQLSLV